jgi:(p)ppGpp synthase/HD superfamily hydrolase
VRTDTEREPVAVHEQVELARRIAKVAHFGQFDKIGDPYIWHPEAVVGYLLVSPEYAAMSERDQAFAQADAWLHDVVEDTVFEVEDLLTLGVHPEVVEDVVVLTHTKGQPRTAYYQQIVPHLRPRAVKRADVRHNTRIDRMRRLDPRDRPRLAAKYLHAQAALDMEASDHLVAYAQGKEPA